MATTNVKFYERIKELQDIHHASEEKRIQLDRQLNSYVKSDQRLAKLQAVKLQNYWKKICEDEKRSQWRNEQLLKDFDRVESQMAMLSARTDKLRQMKKQYEEHIERTYPQWKEKIMLRKQKQEQSLQAMKNPDISLIPGYGTTIPMTGLNQVTHIERPVVNGMTATFTPQGPNAGQAGAGSGISVEHFNTNTSVWDQQNTIEQYQAGSSLSEEKVFTQPHINLQQPVHQTYQVSQHQQAGQAQTSKVYEHQEGAAVDSTMQSVSTLPPGGRHISNETDASHKTTSHHSNATRTKHSAARMQPEAHNTVGDDTAGDADDTLRSEASLSHTPGNRRESTTSHKESRGSHKDALHDTFDSNFNDDSLPLTENDLTGPGTDHFKSPESVPKSTSRQGSLISNRSISPDPVHSPRRDEMVSPVGDISKSEATDERSVYLKADITLDGLYNLLEAVEESLCNTRRGSEFYRSSPPALSVRKDIIENANRGATLSHLDPVSISMIILDQLPLVVMNSEDKCLLHDNFIRKVHADVTDQIIKEHIHPASHAFWDRMYDHFVTLLRYKIMLPSEIASVFASHLIDPESPYESEAQNILLMLLEKLTQEDGLISPSSTGTMSSLPTSPKRKVSSPGHDKPGTSGTASNVGHGQVVDEGDEDDDFFNQSVSNLPTGTMPSLSQTMAYQRMLGGTGSTQRSVNYEDSDEDSDDIEKLAHSVASPRNKNMDNLGSTGLTGGLASANTTGEQTYNVSARDESESELSLPKASTGGYVPSAMTNTGKSTLSMSSRSAAKNPAFSYGDSDTDEDIDIPGTGTKQGLDDDFDFYG